jgi:hypothetical protein
MRIFVLAGAALAIGASLAALCAYLECRLFEKPRRTRSRDSGS